MSFKNIWFSQRLAFQSPNFLIEGWHFELQINYGQNWSAFAFTRSSWLHAAKPQRNLNLCEALIFHCCKRPYCVHFFVLQSEATAFYEHWLFNVQPMSEKVIHSFLDWNQPIPRGDKSRGDMEILYHPSCQFVKSTGSRLSICISDYVQLSWDWPDILDKLELLSLIDGHIWIS